jgi:hypothetical protein
MEAMNPKKLWNAGLRAETPAGSARLNRFILLLNLGVLVVNLFLAFKTTDIQMGLAGSAASSGGVRVVRRDEPSGVAMPYSRVLRTLDSVAPGQESLFMPERLDAIYDAIRRYQAAVETGVANLLYAEWGQDLRAAYADLDRVARMEVEVALGRRFDDAALVQRLATEVIRSCR